DSGGGWQDYNEIIGAVFDMHPHFSLEARDNPIDHQMFNPRPITDVAVIVEDKEHAATEVWHGTAAFRMTDEIYRWKENPRDKYDSDPEFRVLLALDEETHYWPRNVPTAGGLATVSAPDAAPNPVQSVPPLAFPHHSPIAWTKSYGQGRVFYTNLGHNVATWQRPDFLDHLLGGMSWAAATRPDPACIDARIP
ncbi:MAG: ThuA domain-containing protein, partial [Candidatus Binatia bacterium]